MKLSKITFLSGITTLLKLLCGLLISKVVAVYTGPAGIASLGQLQSFVAFINGFISSQISQGVTRYTAEYKNDYSNAQSYWKASLRLSIITGGFVLGVGTLFSTHLANYLFQDRDMYWLILIALAVLPLNVINNIFLGVLNGLGEYQRYFLANVFSVVSSVITIFGFVYFYGLKGALIASAINNALAGIWLFFIIMKRPWFKLNLWFGSANAKQMKDLGRYFLMGVIGALSGPISMIAVRSILADSFSFEASGYWQATMRISEAYLAILTTAMSVYYFPKTVLAKTVSDHLVLLKTSAQLIVPLAGLMAICIFLLKDIVISLLFTEDFYQARELFLFQNIGDFFRVCSWLFATILLAKGYFGINIVLEIVFSLTFPVLVKILIVNHGIKGATMAYCLTYFIYLLFSVAIYVWHLRFKVRFDNAAGC